MHGIITASPFIALLLVSAKAFVVPQGQLASGGRNFCTSNNQHALIMHLGGRSRTSTSSPLFGSSKRNAVHNNRQRLYSAAAAANPLAEGGGAGGNVIIEKLKDVGRRLSLAVPAVAVSTISGGALAGSLHAVTGPDHLAALLPRCIGKRWYQALRIGAVWGLGHGISAILMGMVAFFLKGRLSNYTTHILPKFNLYTEVLIGISLVVIGLLGLKEAAAFEVEGPVAQSLSSAKSPPKEASSKAVFLNGLLHGFSWDGTPTLAPALAFESWAPVMTFLVSYGLGTMISMSTATSLIGEGTVKVGEAFDKPNFPKNLSIVSSIVAIVIGLFWTYKGFA